MPNDIDIDSDNVGHLAGIKFGLAFDLFLCLRNHCTTLDGVLLEMLQVVWCIGIWSGPNRLVGIELGLYHGSPSATLVLHHDFLQRAKRSGYNLEIRRLIGVLIPR